MIRKIRLLPLSIVILSMMLGIRIVDFSVGVDRAFAQSSTPEQEGKAGEHEGEKAGEGKGNEEGAAKEESFPLSGRMPTRKEIEYLQKLGQRRQELDRRARALDDRETLLKAVELRIIERTNSLKKIEQVIEASLKRHDAMEKAQLDSLVKIYSAMKPKEAAQIFNGLEDDVLIAIVENMKEKKMGAILAKMSIDRAKKLTVSLATRKKLPKIEG